MLLILKIKLRECKVMILDEIFDNITILNREHLDNSSTSLQLFRELKTTDSIISDFAILLGGIIDSSGYISNPKNNIKVHNIGAYFFQKDYNIGSIASNEAKRDLSTFSSHISVRPSIFLQDSEFLRNVKVLETNTVHLVLLNLVNILKW
jgi:hypothetical protein